MEGLVKFSTGQLGGPELELRIFPSIHKFQCALAVCPALWAFVNLRPCPCPEVTGEVGFGPPSSSSFTAGVPENPSPGALSWEKHSTFKGHVFKHRKNAASFIFSKTHLCLFVLMRNFGGGC